MLPSMEIRNVGLIWGLASKGFRFCPLRHSLVAFEARVSARRGVVLLEVFSFVKFLCVVKFEASVLGRSQEAWRERSTEACQFPPGWSLIYLAASVSRQSLVIFHRTILSSVVKRKRIEIAP